MKIILFAILAFPLSHQLNNGLISKCYIDYKGTGNLLKRTSFKQDNSYRHEVEFPISKKKFGRHIISDSYTAIFDDSLGRKYAEINIQVSTNKSYRNDVLKSYAFHELNGKIFEHSNELSKLFIGNDSVYCTTPNWMGTETCGSYVYFPSDRMAIYFQLYSCTNANTADSAIIVNESKLFIDSFLTLTNNCLTQ